MSYHINPESGKVALCRAKTNVNPELNGRGCPFGPVEDHYSSADDARTAFEERMSSETLVTHKSLYKPKTDSELDLDNPEAGVKKQKVKVNEVRQAAMNIARSEGERDRRANDFKTIEIMKDSNTESKTGYGTSRREIRDREKKLYDKYVSDFSAPPSDDEKEKIAILRHSMQEYATDAALNRVKRVGKVNVFSSKDKKDEFRYVNEILEKERAKLKEYKYDLDTSRKM